MDKRRFIFQQNTSADNENRWTFPHAGIWCGINRICRTVSACRWQRLAECTCHSVRHPTWIVRRSPLESDLQWCRPGRSNRFHWLSPPFLERSRRTMDQSSYQVPQVTDQMQIDQTRWPNDGVFDVLTFFLQIFFHHRHRIEMTAEHWPNDQLKFHRISIRKI